MGKDYNFCCQDCVEGFRNEPIKFIKDGINCPVMGEPVKKEVSTMLEGTKYYFCCKMCIKEFKDNPDKYLKKNDKEQDIDRQ
jgi:YHS domain-containing protein